MIELAEPVQETSCKLHEPERHWPRSNCYVDLWVTVLEAWGHNPCAALPFAVAQDFEGDQFTFPKFPLEDLASCYGIEVQELAIFDRVEVHVECQQRRGNLTLVEVDAFYLPDTAGDGYRSLHGKTTIAIDRISRAGHLLGYFHNAGYYTLQAADYDGVFDNAATLPPYVEFTKCRGRALRGAALVDEARRLLRRHYQRRPTGSPITAFQAAFDTQLDTVLARDAAWFQLYSFNNLRQLGANFELLGSCLGWLGEDGLGDAAREAVDACNRLAEAAKLLQFRVARMQARQRRQSCDDLFVTLEAAHRQLMRALDRAIG